MKHVKRSFVLSAVLFAMALTGGSLVAQEQPDPGKIATQMKENQEALRQYVWQSRISVEVEGEQKKVDLYQMRYNLDGELERTRMGGESEQKEVRGLVRKRVAEKKQKQAHEFADEVNKKLQAYLRPNTVEKALKTAFVRADQGVLRLQSQNVVEPGDSVEFALVQTTKQPMKLKVGTTIDASPVELNVTFQKLDEGPNYPARSIINTNWDKKKVTVTTENFSYLRQGG